jgi:transcriptional regulator with XRE-family HTH domain
MRAKTYLESRIEKYRRHPTAVAQRAALRVSDRIARCMEEQGLKRGELAKKAGLHAAQVTRALSGEHNLTLATLAKLAAALGVEVWEFFAQPADAEMAPLAKSRKRRTPFFRHKTGPIGQRRS